MGVIRHQLNVENLADLRIKLPLLFHKIARMQEEERKEKRVNDLVFAEVKRLNNLPVSDSEVTYLRKVIEGQEYSFVLNEEDMWEFGGLALDDVVVTAKAINYTNARGFVRAEKGIYLYGGDENYIGGKIKKGEPYGVSQAVEVKVLFRGKEDKKGWLRIQMVDTKEVGWIQKQFIQIIPVDTLLDSYTKKFYYVKSGDTFETDIAAIEYSEYKVKTGDDYRTIAQAFHLLNQQSDHKTGIVIKDADQGLLSALELGYKASIDPAFVEARSLYKKLFLTENHIVRLPSESYIRLQQELGNLSKRSDFMNATIDVVDAVTEILAGAAGLVVGIIEGLLRAIYDALEGIVDLISTIISTIKDLITGELFGKIKSLYETIIGFADLEYEDLKKVMYAVLGNIGTAIQDIIENWKTASAFEKGRVIGIVIGAILLEILVAIFTGGSVTLAKWAGKLGKLGKVLTKIAELGDDMRKALKKKMPDRFKKGDYDKDNDNDGENWQRWALLQQARTTALAMDANGASEAALLGALVTQASFYPKLKVTWPKEDIKADSFDLYMKASKPKKVVDDFTPSSVFRGDDNYDGGNIGIKLGGDADIKTPWEHVRRPGKGESSLFTSFSGVKKNTIKFTKKGKVYKVSFDDLKKIELEGGIKIHTPNSVKKSMLDSGNKKLRKDANNVFEVMKKNNEILIEGIIPESIIKKI
ncbi:hypothetical protein ACFO3O_20005 [Dokdonia ponticola]|uniref:SH3 domain-containing protein n=1 Tax=Dokdonia ponticola TaxID=2041041 RepID=A0ABV9I1B7_9FLAO